MSNDPTINYLRTAYFAAETMQALEMLAAKAEDEGDRGYYVACRLALAILTIAVNGQSKDMNITHIYSALEHAAHVMEGGM